MKNRKDKPITMHVPTLCDWSGLPLLLATPTTKFSLDRKRWGRKRNQKSRKTVFSRSYSSTLLITTPTRSLVKSSL